MKTTLKTVISVSQINLMVSPLAWEELQLWIKDSQDDIVLISNPPKNLRHDNKTFDNYVWYTKCESDETGAGISINKCISYE